ncbi:hypothetical protein FRC02_005269 [Tulasnella sp. 418]|nr:hypothetical protein FRC02_005269 [Tulasnella sp. 418]
MIFLWIPQEAKLVDRHKAILSFASVSSRWYATCVSSQNLWVHVADYIEPLYLEDSYKSAERRLPTLMPHARRWKTLSIGPHDGGKLSTKNISNQHFPRTLPSSVALLLQGIPSPARSSKLTDISFRASINGAPFRSQDYHILSSSAPHLSWIHILGFDGEKSSLCFDAGVHVELLFLKEFGMHKFSWTDMYALMQFIVVGHDNHPSISIECDQFTDYTLPTFTILLGGGPQRSLWNQSSIMTTLTQSTGLNVWRPTGGNTEDEPDLGLRYPSGACGLLLPLLFQGGWYSNIQDLTLIGASAFLACMTSSKDFSYFQHLEVLQVSVDILDPHFPPSTSPKGFIAKVINTLSLSSPLDPHAWFCPRLRHLAFNSIVDADSLKELIKARGINHTSQGSQLARPGPFRIIEISSKNAHTHGALKDELEELAGSHSIELKYVDDLSKDWPRPKFRSPV